MRKKLLDVLGFLRFVLRRWREDRCPQIAGSLTYTTLLAIAPVFAIAVALLASTPFLGEVMDLGAMLAEPATLCAPGPR